MSKKNIDKYLYLNGFSFDNFKLPKIKKIVKGGIYFEFINYDYKLLDYLKEGKECTKIMYNVGKSLGELHIKLKGTIYGFHNDFWSGNILLKGTNIYIIDFEEYNGFESLNMKNSILYNPIWDISMFLFHLKYDLFIYNIFRKKKMYSDFFLDGYKKETKEKHNIKDINNQINLHIQNMINIKRKKNIESFFKIIIWKIIYKFFSC